MGVLVTGNFPLPRQGRVLPLRLPLPMPDFYSDFEHQSDLEWWTVIGGVWVWAAGVYDGNAGLSQIIGTFSLDREVEADMITLVPGGASWDVAWLHPKYVNALNNMTLLIHTTGTIQLVVTFLGLSSFYNFASALSPLIWHRFRVILDGIRAIVYIDGTLTHDIVDVNIPNIVGTVALAAASSHCQYDNLTVRRL